jgi:tetratricopeptide (TPR) repeat protein
MKNLTFQIPSSRQDLKKYLNKYVLIIIAISIIAPLAYCSYVRNGEYRDVLTLAKKDLDSFPNKPRTHNNYGSYLNEAGRYEEALVEFKKAIELFPEYDDALYNAGTALLFLGRDKEAYPYLVKALQVKPNMIAPHNRSDYHNNLGMCLAHLGRTKEAVDQLLEAVRIDPTNKIALGNLKSAVESLKEKGEGNATER